MQTDQALRLALDALQAARDLLADMPIPDGYYSASNEVISKLDAALAQPAASGEPVAFSIGRTLHWHEGQGRTDAQLYATPQPAPARVPPGLRAAAEFTREDLGPTGSNYPHIRTLLAFAESALGTPAKEAP